MAIPTAEEILLGAIDILDRDGWCRWTAHDPDGKHCLLGALDLAAAEVGRKTPSDVVVRRSNGTVSCVDVHSVPKRARALDQALRYVRRAVPPGYSAPSSWNDRGAKSKADVKKVLRQAAKAAKKDRQALAGVEAR